MNKIKYTQFHEIISKTKKSNIKNPKYYKYIEQEIKKSDLKLYDKEHLLMYLNS